MIWLKQITKQAERGAMRSDRLQRIQNSVLEWELPTWLRWDLEVLEQFRTAPTVHELHDKLDK
jgi:CRISPR/Cas system-associated endoribonuclease Cas2